MELVYLWVEEYKNIKNQGFNFSPRFRCNYDDETKELEVIDKEITKEPYLKNFFGENINVTAIVGENGSGKSSILTEILKSVISHKTICFFDNKTNTIYSNIKISKKSNISSFVSMSVPSFQKKSFFYHLKKDIEYPILDNNYAIYTDERNIFTEPNKKDNILNIESEKNRTFRKLINLVHDDFHKRTNIDVFFNPNIIELNKNKIIEGLIKTKFEEKYLLNRYIHLKKDLNIKELILFENIIYFKSLFKSYNDLHLIPKETKCFPLNNEEFLSNVDEVKKELKQYHTQIKKENLLEQLEKQRKKFVRNLTADPKQKIKIYDELEKSIRLFHNIDEIIISLDTKSMKIKIDELNEKRIEIIRSLPEFLNVDIMDRGKVSYKNLSAGEKILLEIVCSIRDIINLREKNTSCENIFILLDEVENSLHPEWQKKLISIILSYIKDFNINIQIILSTHSPFILSDIPKENVVFLEKGKQVYPFENEQTFGANIHTLLSHGFFMESGLIGDFAKSKIDKALEYLNQKVLTKEEIDYCENIISIIGEPIIKRQLQKMLDSKRLSEIDVIKKQIEELQKELATKENKK